MKNNLHDDNAITVIVCFLTLICFSLIIAAASGAHVPSRQCIVEGCTEAAEHDSAYCADHKYKSQTENEAIAKRAAQLREERNKAHGSPSPSPHVRVIDDYGEVRDLYVEGTSDSD